MSAAENQGQQPHTCRAQRKDAHHIPTIALVMLVGAVASISGLLFGYDASAINDALPFIVASFSLSASQAGALVAVVLGGGAVGSLLAGLPAERFGRRVRRRRLCLKHNNRSEEAAWSASGSTTNRTHCCCLLWRLCWSSRCRVLSTQGDYHRCHLLLQQVLRLLLEIRSERSADAVSTRWGNPVHAIINKQLYCAPPAGDDDAPPPSPARGSRRSSAPRPFSAPAPRYHRTPRPPASSFWVASSWGWLWEF